MLRSFGGSHGSGASVPGQTPSFRPPRDDEIGVLEPRLERAVDREPGVAVVRRADRHVAQQGREQRRCVGGFERLQMLPMLGQRRDDVGQCAPCGSAPQLVASQREGGVAEDADDGGEVAGRVAKGFGEGAEKRTCLAPPR